MIIKSHNAIWLRVCTQSRLGRTEVTREEITETLEQILADHARNANIPATEVRDVA